MTARILSALLGAVMLAGAGLTLWRNVAGLSTTHAVFVAVLAAFGGLLIDPAHVGQAIAALIGYARAAKGAGAPLPVAPSSPEQPTPEETP